ncbi:MAG: acylglycerol kinase family protein, partial [Anaerolineales bacterium]|nr:acylglycerol kinase family protein [Anaerolineales bacterium]
MTHYTFIVNPISGRGAGARAIPEIERQALVNELDYDLKVTTRPVEASELARQAARESQVIVAVGGDGTANEVLNGLMGIMEAGQEAPVMGLLAVGRGNDFAFGLGIPAGLDAGFDALLHG